MNNKLFRNGFICGAWLVAVLFSAFFPVPVLRAQPAEKVVHGRFLFIFDTSSNMKRREPAVEKSLNTMLATSLNGQMHKGDTIGVWTFNQDLRSGDFPLQAWNPENAVNIASNLTQFVHSRTFANKTRFESLQPLLNRVVQNSERLTVLIFSDGLTKISGTTFDAGINQLFETNAAAQKKAREPFVVVLRSQQGKYIGCTVTYAPQLVSFPDFPPLPEPPPAPKPAPVPPPAPALVAPSLIITGKKVEIIQPATNPAPPTVTAPAPVVVPTNPPDVEVPSAPVLPIAPTNPPAAAVVNPPAPTNVPVIAEAPTSVPAPVLTASPTTPPSVQTSTPTNIPVVAGETSTGVSKKILFLGAVLFIAAGMITMLAVLYFRRPDRRSLISDSMKDK